MVEVHNKPEEALSDGKQSLTFSMFRELAEQIGQGVAYNNNVESSLGRVFPSYKGPYQG